MEKTYTLQLFGAADRDAFDATFAAMAPGTDQAVQARRRWWCFDNPRGGVFALFHDGEQIAATCYLGGKRIAGDTGSVAGFEIGETATDPRHQRKGLFSKLVRACVAHAAGNATPLVYGTPNSQSTPGYAKLGFEIVEAPASWLFLIPSLRYGMRYGASKWLHREAPPGGSSRADRTGRPRHEVTAQDYVETTASYPRLNDSDRDYLSWRLADAPMNYRFARIDTRAGPFECALKIGQLGDHKVVVVAEYFLGGTRPPLRKAARLLRRAVADLGMTGMGIYVHAQRPVGAGLALLYAARIVPHRVLPICVTGIDAGRGEHAWFGRFQLSDCDIG
jgi:GNAT superfamily N-acetyltransferase